MSLPRRLSLIGEPQGAGDPRHDRIPLRLLGFRVGNVKAGDDVAVGEIAAPVEDRRIARAGYDIKIAADLFVRDAGEIDPVCDVILRRLVVDIVAAVDGKLRAPVRGAEALAVSVLGRRVLDREQAGRIVGKDAEARVAVGAPRSSAAAAALNRKEAVKASRRKVVRLEKRSIASPRPAICRGSESVARS